MANTGLLGMNPYQKGVSIDISSKPTNLVVQNIQKDAAKREALDKYLMEYERSLNPAGMRNQESNIFLNKLNQNKQFYLKNRDCILNPAKCGADAQSQYLGNFKDMLNLIDQSKVAAANDKAFITYLDQAHTAGKRTSDNALDMLKLSSNPIGQGYQAPNAALVEIYNPHDEKKFMDAAWSGVALDKNTEMVPEIINGKPTGKVFPKVTEVVSDNAAKSAATSIASLYDTDHGTREHFDNLLADKDFVSKVNPLMQKWYHTDIKDGKDLAVAYGLAQKQGSVSTGASKYDVNPWDMAALKHRWALESINANKAAQTPPPPAANLFDAIGAGFKDTGSYLGIGKDKKIVDGVVMTKDGSPYTGEVFLTKETLPSSIYTALKAGGLKKEQVSANKGFNAYVKDGRVMILKDKVLGSIDRQTMQDYQLKWNTENPKGVQPGYVSPDGAPPVTPPVNPAPSSSSKKSSGKKNIKDF